MSWLLQIQMLWSLGCMYLFKLWFSLQIHTCMEFLDITVFLVIVFKKKNYTVLHGGCYSFAQSCLTLCDLMDGSTQHFPVLHHLPELAQTHVQWVSEAIQPYHPLFPFFSCFQSFPASGYFLMSWLFALGGQTIGASASALIFPMYIQGWFPLELTGLISFQSKGLSRVFSNTTVQKHQFFSGKPSLWSDSRIHTWRLEKWEFLLFGPLSAK